MMWGERIKELRTQKGVSKYRLAREIGTSEIYLTKIERGEINPSIDRVAEIISHLGCRLEIVE